MGNLDYVFPRERHHVAFTWVFIKFHTSGEGPRDHETLHHLMAPELVPDGLCVVWVGLLEEPLKVVRRRPHLMLVVVHGG
jgi:hypothetical protein